MASKNIFCHGRCCVGVAQGNEVSMLGESIHHYQDDTLAIDMQQALNEVHGDVRLDLRWDLEGLEKASRVQHLCLVALARRTRVHDLTNEATVMVEDKVMAEVLQCLLNAFVTDIM